MQPFEHQKNAIDICTKRNLALFHDCGSGKTATILWTLQKLQQWPAIAVAPKSILQSAWMEDAKKFTPDINTVLLWDNKPKERDRKLATDGQLFITSFEQFRIMYDKIMERGFKVIVVDESSKMKNYKSKITKALLATAGIRSKDHKQPTIIPLRYCLSGTPAPNNLGEYYTQIKFITGNSDGVLPNNYYTFRAIYFKNFLLPNGARIWEFRKNMSDQLLESIKPFCDIVRKEDVLDLPEQVHCVRSVELGSTESKTYRSLKKDAVARIKSGEIVAENVLSEIAKLRQITGGFVYNEGETEWLGESKLKELDALLEEIGDNQVIIWCSFKAEIVEIKKRYGAVTLYADTNDREDSIEKFKTGKAQYLVANAQSAGHGLTFVNASYAVYYSQTYSYELLKQSQDRIHRIGQKDQCTYYYLLSKDTIDEAIYKVVNCKGDVSRAALSYLKGVERW